MRKVNIEFTEALNTRCTHQLHATLTLEVVVAPHIVVTRVERDAYAPIRKCSKASQHAHKALRNNPMVLKPEVKDIAQKVQVRDIRRDAIEPRAESPLSTLSQGSIATTEVYVRYEVNHLPTLNYKRLLTSRSRLLIFSGAALTLPSLSMI